MTNATHIGVNHVGVVAGRRVREVSRTTGRNAVVRFVRHDGTEGVAPVFIFDDLYRPIPR